MSDWLRQAAETAKLMGFTVDWRLLEEIAEKLAKAEEEARELRRRMADWEFIERQPEPLRTALKILVETGDLKYAARKAGVSAEELECLRHEAKIPRVVTWPWPSRRRKP